MLSFGKEGVIVKKKKKKGGKVINAKHIEYIRVSNNVTPKLLLKISHTREPAV